MANGYGSLIAGQTLKESGVLLTQRSSTLPFRISLIKQRKSGIKRSQLKTLRINGKQKRLVRLEKTVGLFQLAQVLWTKMIETLLPAVIAIVTGTAVLFNKVNHRVTILDNRIDKFELKVVENYTSKQEFTSAMLRMEDHLIRIEDKMDQLVNKKCS